MDDSSTNSPEKGKRAEKEELIIEKDEKKISLRRSASSLAVSELTEHVNINGWSSFLPDTCLSSSFPSLPLHFLCQLPYHLTLQLFFPFLPLLFLLRVFSCFTNGIFRVSHPFPFPFPQALVTSPQSIFPVSSSVLHAGLAHGIISTTPSSFSFTLIPISNINEY